MALNGNQKIALYVIAGVFLSMIFVTHVSVAVVFALAAVVALLLAVVGDRIAEIVIGLRGVSIKARTELKETTYDEPVQEPVMDPATGIEPPVAELKALVEVPASGVPATTANDQTVDVYRLSQVPLTVLKNLIELWPNPPAPDDFSGFEYAARRRGKGNFAWYIKFTDRAFWVGYGKGSVRVSPADDDPEKCLKDAEQHHADLRARYERGEGANEDVVRAHTLLHDAFGRATALNYAKIEALVKEAAVWFAEMKKRSDEQTQA
jgi:hypothetical protein